MTEHQVKPEWTQPQLPLTPANEATELPAGNLTACACPPCNRVFASEMAFNVHRHGCGAGNLHWQTNLTLLESGLWGTAGDKDRYEHMKHMTQQLREAQR